MAEENNSEIVVVEATKVGILAADGFRFGPGTYGGIVRLNRPDAPPLDGYYPQDTRSTEEQKQALGKALRRALYSEDKAAQRPASVKVYQHVNMRETGPRLLPVKRAQPKRPEGVSARQWKRQQKAERRGE